MTGQLPIYAVSYPGSGLTWLHMMIGKALDLHFAMGWGESKKLVEARYWRYVDVPEIYFSHPGRPYLTTTENYGQHIGAKFRKAHVVFSARDPRDQVVSMFFKFSRRWEIIGVKRWEGTLSEFIRHPAHGIEGIVAYYNLWARCRDEPVSFSLIRYEDMRQRPADSLRLVLGLMGVEPSQEMIDEAVKFASFDNMWKLESANFNKWFREVQKGNPESRRVRRGKVGGYVDYMTPDDIAFADNAMEDLDTYYGY